MGLGSSHNVGVLCAHTAPSPPDVSRSTPRPCPQIVVWLESRLNTTNSGLSDANLAWIATAKEYIFNATVGEIEL